MNRPGSVLPCLSLTGYLSDSRENTSLKFNTSSLPSLKFDLLDLASATLQSHEASTIVLHRLRSGASAAASSRLSSLLSRSLRSTSYHLVFGLPTGLLPCSSAFTILSTYLSPLNISTWPSHIIPALLKFRETGA